ncbi:hypothetical protein NP493_1675g00014 [Ridgeia piscesae]|uniref:Uncharacterized protein n=1 Tax=Ridgeia piscesae TaxID=27915 RepID=A0AAD9NAF9_RIDPI|nr:hypothetical protein NP493_1675g00014 [Ridgeia piscesae]
MTKQQEPDAERKRKSVRRSSFVRGRISMSMPVTRSTDLSLDIPQDLPESERLEKLCMSVFEHTLEKLNDEFGTLDGMQQMKVQARDAVERRLRDMREDSTLASITVTDTLKTESENWDALVEMRKQKADEAEREEVAASNDIITEPVAPLSAEQEQFLREKPNYQGLLDELKSFREQALLAANELAEKTKVMDHVMEAANEVLKEQAQLLHAHSFESIKNFDSPRTLLGNPSE